MPTNNGFLNSAGPGTPLTINYTSDGNPLYVLLSWWVINGGLDNTDAVSGITFNGAALTRGGHAAVPGNTMEWWRLPAHAPATANVVVTMASTRRVSAGVVNLAGWPSAITDHAFAVDGTVASTRQPSVTVASASGSEAIDWLGFNNGDQVLTEGAGQAVEWTQEGLGVSGVGPQISAGSRKTSSGDFVVFSWGLTVDTEFWGLAALSYTAAARLAVTQQRLLIFIDEDADADIPAEADPCTGGGDVPAGTNPAAGSSLVSAVGPQFWLEVDLGGESPTTLRIAKGPLPNLSNFVEPRVLSFGDVVRAARTAQGKFEAASLDVTISDWDHFVREAMDQVWAGASDTDAWIDAPARLYVQDFVNGVPQGTAQLVFQGLVRDVTAESDLSATLAIEDALTAQINRNVSEDVLIPKAVITSALTDDTPIGQLLGKALPLAYGSLSDESDGDDAVGVAPLRYLKTDAGWDWHLLCLGAVKNIQSVFGPDFFSAVIEPTTTIKFPDLAWGDWAKSPHKPGWITADDWFEVSGKRYTMVLLDHTHPVSRVAREGRLPLSANICGYEDVGDGSGTMIDSLERQFLHFLVNFVWGSYDGTGDWAASIPSLGSYSAIDTDSFEATKTVGEANIEDGVIGAFLIAYDLQQRSALELVRQFCRSLGGDLAVNRYGQLMLGRLDRTSNAGSATTRSDLAHIIKGSFRLLQSREDKKHIVPYVYGRNYRPAVNDLAPETGTRLPADKVAGTWTSGELTVDDGSGGTLRAEQQQYDMVRRAATALWLAQQFRDVQCKGRLQAEWKERLSGTALELLDLTKVTHYKGTGAAGWIERRVELRRHVLKTNERNVLVSARDVEDLLDGGLMTFGGSPMTYYGQLLER